MSDTATRPTSNKNLPAVEAEVFVGVSAVPNRLDVDEIISESTLDSIHNLLPAVLSRLAAGLPMHELSTIIKEARACEAAL